MYRGSCMKKKEIYTIHGLLIVFLNIDNNLRIDIGEKKEQCLRITMKK